jgi:hypothetical protein
MRIPTIVLSLLASLAFPVMAQETAPPAAQAPDAQPSDTGPVPGKPLSEKFNDKLEQLSPSRPEEYYLLGEEVAAEVATYNDRQLAITLFVLAADLDLRRNTRPVTASAACLALADVIKSDRDRRWLIYLSRTLDPRRVTPEWLARPAPATSESPVYQVATALGLVRSGHGVQARQMLDKPEVKEALDRLEPILRNLGGGSVAQLTREAMLWPCSECSNARVIKRGSPPEVRICPRCKADPGPQLTEEQFLGQLRFESMLLQGNQRSWAAQALSDNAAPLRDSDPSTLAIAFDVDTAKVLWRNGQWVVDPNAPPPPPKPRPEPAPDQPRPNDPSAPAETGLPGTRPSGS